MPDTNLQYVLGLSDRFTQVMGNAENATARLESKLGGVNKMALEIAGSFGLIMAAGKAFDFIKDGMKEVHGLNIQLAVMEQTLKNSGRYSKELMENLGEQREKLNNLGFLDEEAIAKAQNQLLKLYPKASMGFRDEFMKTVADMSTDGDVAASVAKLNKLITPKISPKNEWRKNIKALLPEMGLSGFEDAYKKIQNAYKVGHDTQKEMLDIFNNLPGIKGMAEARRKADPEADLKLTTHRLSESLGKLGIEVEKKFLPEMESAVKYIDDLVKNNLEGIKTSIVVIVNSLKVLAEYFIAKRVVKAITSGLEGLIKVFKTTESLNSIPKPMVIQASTVVIETTGVVNPNQLSLFPNGSQNGATATISKLERFGNALGKMGGIMAVGGIGASMAADNMDEGAAKTGLNYAGGALQGASLGMMVGSAILPGIGTAVGAGVGAGIGMGITYWKETSDATKKSNDIQQRILEATNDIARNSKVDSDQWNTMRAFANTTLKGKELQDKLSNIDEAQTRKNFSNEFPGGGADMSTMMKYLGTTADETRYLNNNPEVINEIHKMMKENNKSFKESFAAYKYKSGGSLPDSGSKMTNATAESNVKGTAPTNYYITIPGGLIQGGIHFDGSTTKSEARDIINTTVKEAMLQALNGFQPSHAIGQ